MPQPFDKVREQLLHAGIAPRHARRYVTELGEHLADLTARERATGHDAKEAAIRARAALGSDEALAQAMISKPGFRSIAARAPWAVFGLLPPVAFFVLTVALTLILVEFLRPFIDPRAGLSPVPQAYRDLAATVTFAANYLLGPLAAAGCIALALRQRVSSRWVWVGLALVAAVSALFGLHVYFPPAGSIGIRFALASFTASRGHIEHFAPTLAIVLLRGTLLLAVAGAAYHVLRTRAMQGHVMGKEI